MNTYRDKILSSWLCYKVWVLSKTQDLTTAEERERTKVVPYALDVGSTVCYAVYRTWSVPCHELVKGYNSDPEWITWQRSNLSLVSSGLRNFLDYGGEKEFVVKGYVDENFDTNPDDSE